MILNDESRIPVLDGLRAFVLLVALVHFRHLEQPSAGAWGENVYYFAAEFGLMALDVFFVLSGFLITGILLDSKGSTSFFRTFYTRRLIRIFPLYYGFLFIFFVLLPRLYPVQFRELTLTPIQHLYYWAYLTNVGLAVESWGALTDFTDHLWSLAVEEQFYLLWPAIVHLLSRNALKATCLICIIAAPIIRVCLALVDANLAGYALTPARADGLALGSLVAIYWREPEATHPIFRQGKRMILMGISILVALFFYLGNLSPHRESLVLTLGLTASTCLAGGILIVSLMTAKNSWWCRVIGSWPFREIGRYSYAIYVLHFPLVLVLDRLGIVQRSAFDQWFGSRIGAELAYVGIMMLASLIAGALSWHLYEKHFLKLRRRIPYQNPRSADPRMESRSGGAPCSTNEKQSISYADPGLADSSVITDGEDADKPATQEA